jgi:hypothetical protein
MRAGPRCWCNRRSPELAAWGYCSERASAWNEWQELTGVAHTTSALGRATNKNALGEGPGFAMPGGRDKSARH